MNNSDHDPAQPEWIDPVSELQPSDSAQVSAEDSWPPAVTWIQPGQSFWPHSSEFYFASLPQESPQEELARRRPPGGLFGWSEILCWGLIVTLAGFIWVSTVVEQLSPQPSAGSDAAQNKGHLMQLQLNGKFLVAGQELGNADLFGHFDPAQTAQHGSLLERYGGAILVAEMDSSQRALQLLNAIDSAVERHGYQPTEMETRVRSILGDIFSQRARMRVFDNRTIPEDDRAFLIQQLGWLGKVALAPVGSPDFALRQEVNRAAKYAVFGVAGVGLLFVLIVLVGLVLAIIAVVLAAMGRMRSGTTDWSGGGLIYLETFTIWFFVFFGMQFGLGASGVSQAQVFSLLPFVFFGSLVVLVWPLLRGRTWRQIVNDLGMAGPRRPLQVLWGIPSYCAVAPAVVAAAIVNVLIAGAIMSMVGSSGGEFEPSQGVGHPLQDELAGAGSWAWWGAIISMCLAAPIVEEVFFRGVFYRYLRDRFVRWRRWLAVAGAALINSVIFAAIHPQGIMGILLLTTLAMGLTLVREWRGSLYPSIMMHAINNSLVAVLMIVVFSG